MNNSKPATDSKNHDFAVFLQRFSSKVLWHFTGYRKSESASYGILNTILESNTLKLSRQNEKVIMNTDEIRFGGTIACVCDIPFRDLRIHTMRYGPVGIGFHKAAAINEGHFNPVLYIHRSNPSFIKAHDLIKKNDTIDFTTEQGRALHEYLGMIGSYMKPSNLDRNIEVDPQIDSSQNNNFYYEREWRTVSEWKFADDSITVIVMPQRFLADFQKRWGNRFVASSIILSEMIETL